MTNSNSTMQEKTTPKGGKEKRGKNMDVHDNTIRPFARQGHFTVFDNAVLDIVMPTLSGSEWKLLSFVIRKTIGWQKNADALSYTQIREGTGIKSDSTVQKAIKGLLEKSLILVAEQESVLDANLYAVNRGYEIKNGPSSRTTENGVKRTSKNGVRPEGPRTTKTVDTKEREKKNINKGDIQPDRSAQKPGRSAPQRPPAHQTGWSTMWGPAAQDPQVQDVLAVLRRTAVVNKSKFFEYAPLISDELNEHGLTPSDLLRFAEYREAVTGFTGKPHAKTIYDEIGGLADYLLPERAADQYWDGLMNLVDLYKKGANISDVKKAIVTKEVRHALAALGGINPHVLTTMTKQTFGAALVEYREKEKLNA